MNHSVWGIVSSAFVIVQVFFFQAEDGIRDLTVTGVQTCALPIFGKGFTQGQSFVVLTDPSSRAALAEVADEADYVAKGMDPWISRSEERRVGKECRSRWSQQH